ncbi:MAG: MFS transporter [Candidatus Pacebacteria bacterium]|nr:MFS transporter [Candidatus Paceibacterota bacterium]
MLRFYRTTEWQLLWPFYMEALFGTILYIFVPFMVLYFNSIGMGASEIGILMSVWPLSALLFEVPTGAIADLWGRKLSVILGYFCEGILAVLLFFFTHHAAVFVLFFFIGVARTLTSGAKEAWVVDLLRARGHDDLRSNYFSKYYSLFNLAFVISGVIGALCVDFAGLQVIWLVTGISYFMSAGLLMFGREDFIAQRETFSGAIKGIWRQTRRTALYALNERSVTYVYVISFTVAMAGIFRSMISWTPFLQGFGFPDEGFGYLWSAMNITGVAAPLLARRLLNRVEDRIALIWISVLTLAYGVLVLLTGSLFMLIGLIIVSAFIFDFRMPINRVFFHRFIPTHIRSTSGSFEQMLNASARMISFPLVGILIDGVGPKYTVFISTLFMIPVIVLYSRVRDVHNEKSP